eukprot:scaffold300471_cov39-Tisochrysis_lutea.AAC.2
MGFHSDGNVRANGYLAGLDGVYTPTGPRIRIIHVHTGLACIHTVYIIRGGRGMGGRGKGVANTGTLGCAARGSNSRKR